MSFFDSFLNRIANGLADRVLSQAQQQIITARSYRMGYQREQLNVRPNQYNDNITINECRLVVDRIVSQMFGKGIQLDFHDEGETSSPEADYIHAILSANEEEVLFHRCGIAASESGTGYMMILPDGRVSEDGKTLLPRLMLQDSAFVEMTSLPEDYETVIRYTISYNIIGLDGKAVSKRRVIEQVPDTGQWLIVDSESSNGSGGRFVEVNRQEWPYSFAPIIHWQNRPSVSSAYGEPDLTPDVIELQDKINFSASNISKIIRLYAHPQRVGFNLGASSNIAVGPDTMPSYNADGRIDQLEPVGDLASSITFWRALRSQLFDVTRTVDVDALYDKLGQLTNFGLSVLYQDNLSLIDTKRELFSNMLEDLINRLLVLNNMQPVHVEVIWPDVLPRNEVEQVAGLQFDLDNSLVSKQTAAVERGRDWDRETERIAEEKTATGNVGAALLAAFNKGQ
jgi:hypothetical protein